MWMPGLVLAASLIVTKSQTHFDFNSDAKSEDRYDLPANLSEDYLSSGIGDGFSDEGKNFEGSNNGLDTSNFLYKRSYEDDEDKNIVDSDNPDEMDTNHDSSKRFLSIFRTRPPKSEGYKRGPGFRSWGGKRSGFLEPDFLTMKRDSEFILPFQQSQKRGNNFEDKRRPFQSWGGKRSQSNKNLHYLEWSGLKNFLNGEKKRKFSSWGGKRGDGNWGNEKSRKKPSFQSWGGKRSPFI